MAMSTPAGSNPAAGGLALEHPKLDFKVADFNPSQRNDLRAITQVVTTMHRNLKLDHETLNAFLHAIFQG